MDAETEASLESCEQRIGYAFRDRCLLFAALTHASGARHRLASNERLEFLGDAILGLVVCERLYHDYPDFLEGDLTRIKSVVVSRQTCAKVSADLKLDEFLVLGKGMAIHRTVPNSLLADVFESLVAAIYLDGGIDPARNFIETHMVPQIDQVASGSSGENYKSLLQHYAQREYGKTPTYTLVDQKGPDHNKMFKVAATIGKLAFAPAWGKSKKEAEQRAARKAISDLEESNDGRESDDESA
ncbi:MAG: ribonuclease III [Planctomycetales bacterium]|nr:ribonuclease III [Planctomycetales bacterium]